MKGRRWDKGRGGRGNVRVFIVGRYDVGEDRV